MGLIKNNNLGLSRAFDVMELDRLLEESAKAGSRESKWTKKKSFAPSGIGYGNGTCPRYWYYAFNGAFFNYDDTTGQQIQNMNNGTAAGERLAKLLEGAGILVAAEVPVDHQDPPIGGFIDAIVNWKDEEIVCEVKTTKNETWQMRANKMQAPGYQLIQLLIYMKVMKKDKGFFLIENKNDHGILILPIKMTPEYEQLVDNVFEWMRTVKDNADNGQLPTRPFTKSSIPCKGCPVKDTCWDGFVRTNKTKGTGADPNPGVVTLPPLVVPK